MKIETFSAFTEKGLSAKVNEFLENNTVEVIDIKFSTSISYLGAMVIYKTLNKE